MNTYDIIKINNHEFEVTYTKTRNYVYACTSINGKKLEIHGRDKAEAFVALKMHIFQELNFHI